LTPPGWLPAPPPLFYANHLVVYFVFYHQSQSLFINYSKKNLANKLFSKCYNELMPTNPKNKEKTVILLDSHAIIHRAYHALPDFMSSKGEPTGALYGLSSMLMKIVTDLKPDYIIACYDLLILVLDFQMFFL
jgi:hypothetical protein